MPNGKGPRVNAGPTDENRLPDHSTPPSAFQSVPAEMRAMQRWVTWRREQRGRKTTKRSDQRINEPEAWLSFDEACRRAQDRLASGEGGIGFVLGDGIVGIDVDDCFGEAGDIRDDAQAALGLGSYAERSPSGNGLHVFVRATIERPCKLHGLEIYDGRPGSARYFTVTGRRIGAATEIAAGSQVQADLDAFVARYADPKRRPAAVDPAPAPAATADGPLDDDRILEIMFGAVDGERWQRLYGGDHARYASQSEADLALVGKLRFYTKADRAQVDRLFRRSGLMRAKWDELRGERTYGDSTIAAAFAEGRSDLRGTRPSRP